MSESGSIESATRSSSTPRPNTSWPGVTGGRLAACALLDAAEGWLRERGRDRMVGPMDFTTNDEIGLLIAGHEHPPVILCQWHHPYYQRLIEQEDGMGKAMDLYMWSLHITGREKVHPAIWQAADGLEAEHGIVCRPFRKKDLHAE